MSETFKITGTIEEFPEIKIGAKKDGTPYTRIGFKVKGMKMSTFNKDYVTFTKGDDVQVEGYTTEGEGGRVFNNIQTMTKLEESMPEEETKEEPKEETKEETKEKTKEVETSPAKEINDNYYTTEKKKNASIVSQVVIKALGRMVASGKIASGHMETTARQLTAIYEETVKKLLE